MAEMTYLAAIGAAQREALADDPSVILMGEDVTANLYGTAPNFLELFGSDRIRNTPISEACVAGIAAGAAMTGMRPIVDLTYASFMYLAMDQIVNQVAKSRYMFGGQARIPVVYRAAMFYRASTAAHHSDRSYPMFMNVPGLKIVAPASPHDAKGLLSAAVDCDDPVIVFEDATLWMRKQDVPTERFRESLGEARVVRSGDHVTVVAIGGAVLEAAAAAEQVCNDGISVEVIDPRTLVPLDIDSILRSVAKTRRLVIADPANRTCGAASEISAIVAELAFDSLVTGIRRVTTPDVHVPFSPALERHLYPDVNRIAEAIRGVCETDAPSRPAASRPVATESI